MSEDATRWSRLKVYLWGAWVVLVVLSFALLERAGLKTKGDDHPELTKVIRHYIPGWLFFTGLFAAFGWALWHFVQTYLATGP